MKQNFRRILALCVINIYLLFIPGWIQGQEVKLKVDFDEGWLGTFEGDLKMYNGQGLVQEIPMKLIHEFRTDSTLRWAIQYGEDESDLRDYTLLTEDPATGHFLVDEHNTILLDEYQIANTFISWFEVMGTVIVVKYTLEGDYIIFEILSSNSEPVRTTGGELHEGEEIPVANSYKVNMLHRAILKRV